MSENEFGKFRDAESLYKAYLALESEFTRKCQSLKELEEKIVNQGGKDNDLSKKPIYESEDWEKRIDEFMKANPKAVGLEKDISRAIMSDENIQKSDNCLELAFMKVLQDKYRSEEDLMNDENFAENLIAKRPEVKDKIIKSYIEEIEKRPPVVMTDGGSMCVTPPKKPKSIEEAGALARELLK